MRNSSLPLAQDQRTAYGPADSNITPAPVTSMAETIELSDLDLAALLCSKVCHDIISPVGAITNGLEVLDEDGGEDMRVFAMELIQKSARQASAKLKFARLAFGAAGSAGAEVDLADAEAVAMGYMEGEKADMTWSAPRLLVPKNKVKLLLNLVLIANAAIPRGGTIDVLYDGDAVTPTLTLRAVGPSARIPTGVEDFLAGRSEDGVADAHSIQQVYAGKLARAAGMTVTVEKDGDDIVVTARS